MRSRDFKLGQFVYHRDVYEHKERLKIVGIREDELELEGDYSGGTHNVIQREWKPVEGVALIENYKYKEECLDFANEVIDEGNMTKKEDKLTRMIIELTRAIQLNPEF